MLLVSKSSAMDEPTTDPQSGRRQCTIYILGISGVKKMARTSIFWVWWAVFLLFCVCVCVFLCVRQFTMWTRRDLAVHNIVHHRSPYCPKGEKNVDLLGLGLVRFFFPFVDNFCSWACANHIGDIRKYLNLCRWFVVLRGDFVASEPKIAPYWPRRCPFYRAVVPQLARGWV